MKTTEITRACPVCQKKITGNNKSFSNHKRWCDGKMSRESYVGRTSKKMTEEEKEAYCLKRYGAFIGKKFYRLTVIKQAETRLEKRMWVCKCECGRRTTVCGSDLISYRLKSCGCYRDEVITTHGMSGSSEYSTWNSMIQRCYISKNSAYKYYGALGVTVCKRWRDSFENFYTDMGKRPEGLTLDRIDPFGNYEPKNCRWATWKQQANNKRSNHIKQIQSQL